MTNMIYFNLTDAVSVTSIFLWDGITRPKLLGFELCFPSPRLVVLPRFKNFSMPSYLPIAR